MRFNQRNQRNSRNSGNQTENSLAGDVAFEMSPELALYAMVCTSALQPTYYIPNTNDQLNRIKARLREVDPVFAAQLAVYAREKMYLRTIPLVLTAELAKIHNGDSLLRRLTRRVVQRADEITELVAYYCKANGLRPKLKKATNSGHMVEKKIYKLSNQVRKGLADAFGKFDEYQFAKYNRPTEIKLRDVLFLTHPKPQNEQQRVLYEKIANDTLSVPVTWETQLSKAGQEGLSKKKVWEGLILSDKMGYMAMLRNLRNFLKEDISPAALDKALNRLSDPAQVRRSKQLPFRFLSAYRMLAGGPISRYDNVWNSVRGRSEGTDVSDGVFTPLVLEALEKAVLTSIENISMFGEEDEVLIAADVSGSMQRPVSEKSVIQNYDIGALLAMLAKSRCKSSVVGMFGDIWKPLDDMPTENVLRATNELHAREGEVGYSTNGWRVIEWAISRAKMGVPFNKVMIFTDCQMWDSTGVRGSRTGRGRINKLWRDYKHIVPNARLYLFNLIPYGQTPIDLKDGDVHLISGWSDKVFEVMDNIERGGEVLDQIKEIRL